MILLRFFYGYYKHKEIDLPPNTLRVCSPAIFHQGSLYLIKSIVLVYYKRKLI